MKQMDMKTGESLSRQKGLGKEATTMKNPFRLINEWDWLLIAVIVDVIILLLYPYLIEMLP